MRVYSRPLGACLFLATSACFPKVEKSVEQVTVHRQRLADAPAVHTMLVLGSGPIYLSHLPMFHKPRDYQVILEAELVKHGTDPVATYVADRKVTGEQVYTLLAEPFSLPELFDSSQDGARRKTFTASLFRGHCERGGQEFISNLSVQVRRVIYAKKFERNPPVMANLQYLLFGNKQELFAAHLIAKKPDFDHLVGVRLSRGVLTDAQAGAIRSGLAATFPELGNGVAQALREGPEQLAKFKGAGAVPNMVAVDTLHEYYLETGDLSD